MNELVNVIILSTIAGLATGFGSLIATVRKPGKKLFGLLMGFAAGVMVAISFLGLVNEAWKVPGSL